MDHATRPPRGELSDPADRILRLVEEWEAITDPTERRLLLEELGYERIDRKGLSRLGCESGGVGLLEGDQAAGELEEREVVFVLL
jgi:hypothetical protein